MNKTLGLTWWKNKLSRHLGIIFLTQALIVFGVGYWAAQGGRESPPTETAAASASGSEAAAGTQIWTCSMHPQIRQPHPGKCPICAMDLIPVTKTSGGLRTLTVSPDARALMQIETEPVERKYVTHDIRLVGKVDYDETKLGYITAWVAGRLDRLYADFTGIQVKKGDHLVYIYSEELYAVQEELIQSLKYAAERRDSNPNLAGGNIDLVESTREKLRLLGLTDEQIQETEKRKQPSSHLTIYSPVSGAVIEKLKQEGERVRLGERIYTVADLSQVWVHLDVYEADLPWVRYGQEVTITTEAYPGERFQGRISFIQPVLNDKTRTVKVRVNVPNASGKLKPEMFVHAVVRPKVAAGGRVMDPSLAGKWISPMHPEIVKDGPGTCDICGMPLVRAETLGYVTPEADQQGPPLVIPCLAALVTGTRAIAYVELPSLPTYAEPAFRTLSATAAEAKLDKSREAFATYGKMLDRPYDQPGTAYAKRLWGRYADRLAQAALAGQRASTAQEAEQRLAALEATMAEAREQFADPGQPTFEGREIVLGPRAGSYYLVRHGLEEGELVVTQGNFKIDAEIQIQAKPSMMTPEGGEGHADHQTALPAEFRNQFRELDAAYDDVAEAVSQADLAQVRSSFDEFGKALQAVDGRPLEGHPRMLWKELAMLLGNDVAEGRDVKQAGEADRVYLLLKGRMRRLRDQLGLAPNPERVVEAIAVPLKFQAQLAAIWRAYLTLQSALAGDDFEQSRQALVTLQSAPAAIADAALDEAARRVWKKERANLNAVVGKLQAAPDIDKLRTEFSPLSDEIGVLVKTFGLGNAGHVYELHCPMAFQGRGATWYQADDQVKNPYFGSSMLKCADRVEEIRGPGPSSTPGPK